MREAAIELRPFPATAEAGQDRKPDDQEFRNQPIGEQQPPRGLPASLTLFAMSLGYGVVQLDVTIVNTALDRIGSALGGGVSELQWVVNAYTIAFAAFILTSGALGDRIGAKRVFMAGFAIFTTASLACALAPNSAALIAARAVQGLGAAVLVPNSLALLNHAYRDRQARGRAVGIWAAGASLALTAGPLAGGALIALIGWRSIFLVNVPIGIAGLWLSWRYATETTRNRQREVDLPGQCLAIAALGCLAGTIIEGGAVGLHNSYVIAGFAASALLALLFIVQERRSSHPMLPLSLFGHRLFALTSLVGLLVNIAFYGLIFVFSLYFQRVNGLTPLQTGLAFVPMMGIVLPANLVAARISERIGAPAAIAAGGVLAAAGCVTLLPIEPGTPYVEMLAQLMIIGGGLGLLVPPLTATLLGSVETSRSGIAAGVLNATRQTGSVLGVALFGSLVGQPDAFMRGAHLALMISVVLLLIASVVIWRGAATRD
ncbi:MFS transporter [Bradyrhizobium erythrophlei]|uniref:MFS transporter, DHA2 family, methylenomycin A resistance protein n=1 Tax=Bradyrhizobium erythrophlei TaxID=1437360 RepID=A0A1M7UIU5_9BRAD|nr:MFS transporter [Bradyrhizobium erythrophlei]SHN82840.1 MFS transporter, DHA2 family, methylenomycin A resistance protein [Bradyrhizobium erythrophlei]